METSYIMGIDGGGTRTSAIVAGVDGRVVCHLSGQSINYNSVGMEAARGNMKQLVHKIRENHGIYRFAAVCIGTSALFQGADDEEKHAFTNEIFHTERVILKSDICVALESLLTDGACALAISGTGSMCAVRDDSGNIRHTGGWGYILGDEGSAYHIAISGIKAAIAAYDGTGPATSLQNTVMQHFKIRDMQELVTCFYNPVIAREEVSLFATQVAACAESGDTVALDTVRRSAGLLAKSMLVLLHPYDGRKLPVGISGGVFENNVPFRHTFAEEINNGFPTALITRLAYPPQVGALFCCMRDLGLSLDDTFLKNVSA